MKYFMIVFGILFFGFAIAVSVAYKHSDGEATILVSGKETKITGGGEEIEQKYLIFSEGEVFEVTDTVLFWRFDSSDMYGQLKEGKSYRVKTAGWRIPVLSMYRNILEAKEVI